MIKLLIAQVHSAAVDSSAIRIAENSKTFSEIDPTGLGITFIGISVVFLALLMLYILFSNITRALNYKRIKPEVSDETKPSQPVVTLTGEVNAAIAVALHLNFLEAHDYENTILTIRKVERRYSPWSSKIYGLRQSPR